MIYRKHQTFNFRQKFSKMIIACFKKWSRETEKNLIFVYPGLRYADKKLEKFFWKKFLWIQNWFEVEKKNFQGNIIFTWKNFVVAIKKMLVLQFSFMEIVW